MNRPFAGATAPLRDFNGTRVLWAASMIVAAGTVGLLAGGYGPLSALIPALVLIGMLLLVDGRRLNWAFFWVLGGLLVLYAFWGRGGANIGAPPFFVGEIGFALAVLVLVRSFTSLRLTFVHWTLLGFIAWGVVRTIPYLGEYDILAMRDAALWGYALFALALSIVIEPRHVRLVVEKYGRILPFFVVWALLILAATSGLGVRFPDVSRGVPLIQMKAGDTAVHLAGIMAFILVGLWTPKPSRRHVEFLLLALWVVAAGLVGTFSRGGLLAMSGAFMALTVLRPSWNRLLKFGADLTLLAALMLLVGGAVDLGPRSLSPSDLGANFISVVNDERRPDLAGTKQGRLDWWNTIIDYTIEGDYFWEGKGFGRNLAREDGFIDWAEGLRSPHNVNMTVLARMGMIGLALWSLFLIAFVAAMLRALLRMRRQRQWFWAAVNGWLLAYLLASFMNGSFDVYLEGPQGGIWFWTLIGLGLAVLRIERQISTSAADQQGENDDPDDSPFPAGPGSFTLDAREPDAGRMGLRVAGDRRTSREGEP